MISVIIPVYKVEKYLDECIMSVVSQTYKDIEVIIVDDGSPDSCPQICDNWAKKDSRIRVIHQENAGLSVARNIALEAANGEYIAFVDSDDFIHPLMLEKLYQALTESNADISMCGFDYFVDGTCSFKQIKESKMSDERNTIQLLSHTDFVDLFADLEVPITAVVWNKLYKKEVISDTVFKPGVLIEDIRFISELAHRIDKVVSVNEKLYFYRNRERSIMHYKKDVLIHKANAFEDCILSFIKSESDTFIKKYISSCLNKVANSIILLQKDKEEYKDIINSLRQWYVKIYDKYRKQFGISSAKLWLYRYFPKMYELIKRKG